MSLQRVLCLGAVGLFLACNSKPPSEAPPTLVIPDQALGEVGVGEEYSYTLAAEGGKPHFSFAAEGLPAGLVLDATSGKISGVPTAAGEHPVTVTVTDAASQQATRIFLLRVLASLAISTASLREGYLGEAFAQTLSSSGGLAPYRWSSRDALPAGLKLGPEGALTGTPIASGSFAVVISVTDARQKVASKPYALEVFPAVAVSADALGDGSVGVAYSQQIAAGGGKAPYTFSAAPGSLPPGLILAQSGAVSGTPSSEGTFRFSVQVKDANGRSAAKTITLAVFDGLAISSASLADGYFSRSYAGLVGSSGGKPPVTFSIVAGDLPPGLSLGSGGALSGTPTSTGSWSFSVRATDALGRTAGKTFSIEVLAQPAISTQSLVDGVVGKAYAETLATTGGRGPFTFAISSGALLSGLSLSTGGVLLGTPSVSGSASFTVTAKDANGVTASGALNLSVFASLTGPGSLPDAYAAVAYSQVLSASGGKPPYAFTLGSGSLPAGISLSTAGTLAGTTASSGSFPLDLVVSDSASPAQAWSKSLTLAVVQEPRLPPLSLADGYTGSSYSAALNGTGGKAPSSYALTQGALPAGLTLDGSSGDLQGIPTAVGAASFEVAFSDGNGLSAKRSYGLTTYQPPAITTSTLSPGYVGQAYSQTLAAAGGKPPLSWSLPTGSPSPGLSLDVSGSLTGVPSAPGSAAFVARVTDANGRTASVNLTLVVYSPLLLGQMSLPDAYLGQRYNKTFTGTGGLAPYSYSLAGGAFPPGLTLDGSLGALSGAASAAGDFTFLVKLTDSSGASDSKSFTIHAFAPPRVLATSPLPDAYKGAGYSHTLAASGGKPPLAWTLIGAGVLPSGISLSSQGVLSGMPTQGETQTFTVQLSDANGLVDSRPLSFTVKDGFFITTSSINEGRVGISFNQAISALGGAPPYSFSVIAGALPPGLSLSSAGDLAGTPVAGGSYGFTIQVRDSAGAVSSRIFNQLVTGPSSVTVSPAQVSIYGGSTQQFAASEAGSPTNNAVWSVQEGPAGGTVSAAGLYQAPTVTTNNVFHVVATSISDPSQSGLAEVTVKPVVTVSVSPESVTLSPGETQQFSASVTGAANTAVVWTLQEGAAGGTLDQNGNYTAPSTTNTTFHVVATSVADPSKKAVATITSIPLVTLTLCPTSAALVVGDTLTLTPFVTGSPNSGVKWSLSGPGSLDQNGLYTASASGEASITVTSLADPRRKQTAQLAVYKDESSLSGTVSYGGARSGRVYVSLEDWQGGTTSISVPGAYRIRGIRLNNRAQGPGTYTVRAWMDTLGTGRYNFAADPAGAASISWNGTSLANVNITLADPAPQVLTAPASVSAVPLDGAALIVFEPIRDTNQNELADHYRIWAGTSPNPGPTQNVLEKTIKGSNDAVILFPLINGTSYYFAVAGMNGATVGPASSTGPVAIGPGSGSWKVSGSVEFSGIKNPGTLYAFLSTDQKGSPAPGNIFLTRVANPQSPQAFSVSGVPDGGYEYGALLDLGSDGEIDSTDPATFRMRRLWPTVSVNGADVSLPQITLPSTSGVAQVNTYHYAYSEPGSGYWEGYGLSYMVAPNLELPVKAAIVDRFLESKAAGPLDLRLSTNGGGGGGQFETSSNVSSTTPPAVGQAYTFDVSYASGVTCNLSASITGVLGVPTNVSPSGQATSQPTFSWSAPSPAPAWYQYEVSVRSEPGGGEVFRAERLPSNTSSLPYTGTPLADGVYRLEVRCFDSYANMGIGSTRFTVGATDAGSGDAGSGDGGQAEPPKDAGP